MELTIRADYTVSTIGTVQLPQGKTWNNVKKWFIKWDELHILFDGDKDITILPIDNCNGGEFADWKNPSSVSIHPVIDGRTDWDTQLFND